MRRLYSKRGIALGMVFLLALFLVRPGAQQLKSRIVSSISTALGRPVTVSSVSLQFLPQPAFDLENFVVSDAPEFGAEPMLQAQEVTASLRLSSLFRGRLEISRLSLSQPSLNLVQNDRGHWNAENLLQRTAQISVAPTSKSRGESRPAFPYIEADSGRINFKIGQEKKPYALTDADFSLWQESENSWGMRLEASPVRTDHNLTDTGTLRVSGNWRRAASLRETPMQISLRWTGGQLGQATKLAYGGDLGWRGGLSVIASLRGTPADLRIDTKATIENFHRYDLLDGEIPRLGTECKAHYSSVDQKLSGILCQSPAGSGLISLSGSINRYFPPRQYELTATVQKVPVQSAIALLQSAKKDVPDDLNAGGLLNAKINLARNDTSTATWKGDGEISDLAIQSAQSDTELHIREVPFTILSEGFPRLEIGAFHLDSGANSATIRGVLSRTGYDFRVRGTAQIQHLLRMAEALGISSLQPAASGLADVNLQIAGTWDKFAPSRPVGTIQLKGVRAELAGISVPVQIRSATILLKPTETQARKISATVAGSAWRGSLKLPRPCASPDTCAVQFDLSSDALSSEELANWLSAQDGHRPWYRFLYTSRSNASFWPHLRASGSLHIHRLFTRQIVNTDVFTNLSVKDGIVQLHGLRAKILGGLQEGNWELDFSKRPFVISGDGKLEDFSLAQLAEAMHDDWITGNATATYRIKASGTSMAQLMETAKGAAQVEVEDGWLPHISLTDSGPLQVQSFHSNIELNAGTLTVDDGKLETPDGIYGVSGTATLARSLDLKLTREGIRGFSITGTLTAPHVAQAGPPATRAALKR